MGQFGGTLNIWEKFAGEGGSLGGTWGILEKNVYGGGHMGRFIRICFRKQHSPALGHGYPQPDRQYTSIGTRATASEDGELAHNISGSLRLQLPRWDGEAMATKDLYLVLGMGVMLNRILEHTLTFLAAQRAAKRAGQDCLLVQSLLA